MVSHAVQVSCAWDWFLTFWPWQCGQKNVRNDLAQRSDPVVGCALLVWGILCVCLLLFGLKWVTQHRLHWVVHVPASHVPQCVGLNKNLRFSLSVPLLTLPFGWLKELVLLRTCFCLCKITFVLEITSDCGLKRFLGIIIHYGSDFFLANCFQRMLFSSCRAVITCFSLLSWCFVGECCS